MSKTELSRRGFLKLMALTALAGSGVPSIARQPRPSPHKGSGRNDLPNILILLMDTFTARHISLYGYRRETTPNLARFAERATVFHHHHASGNFTMPGTASLLTGTYPWTHRGLHLFGSVARAFHDRNIFSLLSDDYYCSAFTHNTIVSGILNQFQRHIDQITMPRELAILAEPLADRILPKDFYLSFWGERVIRGSGTDLPDSLFMSFIGRDFDPFTPQDLKRQYGNLFPRGLPNNSVGEFFLLEQAIDWVHKQALELPRPFLGYYHLLPPHEPYKPRTEFIGLFRDGWAPEPKPVLGFPQGRSEQYLTRMRNQYDEYVAFVDAEFGRLYDALDRSGILDNTYFILTSDHGQLFERGIHGHLTSTLYEPLLHIPLLIAKPGQKQRVDVDAPTSCVDLLPTLCHLTGRDAPEWSEGKILPGFGGGESPDDDRPIYALEAKNNPRMGPLREGTMALFAGGKKLIHYFGFPDHSDNYELYDLKNDPQEREDVFQTSQGLATELKGELIAKLDRVNQQFQRG
jgi:arylsulfatase A-like enzyme